MSPSVRLQSAQTFISSFATLSQSSFHSVLSPTFTHDYAPTSLLTALSKHGHASRDAFLAHIASVSRLMTGFPVEAKAWVEDEAQNAVWCWAKSKAEWREEVKNGPEEEWVYEGEYVFMFWMDDEGRIERCVEMLDSGETKGRLLGLSGRARENIKKKTGEEVKWLAEE